MKRELRVILMASTALSAPMAVAQEPFELEAITVEGASYETEGTDSYKSGLISVGEKAAMTPREVPQSTTVITRKQIEDGGYTSLETAVADAPGLIVLNNDEGRSSLFSRGFEFDYLYYDGLPAPVSSIYGTQPDLAMMDHIEVLKGPSGLFIGTGSPAGSINMRLKQANRTDPGGYVTSTVDSNGRGRVEADYGGALNKDGTLRGRAVLAYADGDGFVDKQENGVKLGYATLAWDIAPTTTATLSFSRMERDIAPYNGLPTYADRSLIWIDPSATTAADWNRFDNEVTDVVAAVEHRFDGGGRLKFSARKSWQSGDFLYAWAGSAAAADNTVSRLEWLAREFDHNNLALDLHAELPFVVGGWDGIAIVGADMQHNSSTYRSAGGVFNGSWDLDNWDVSGLGAPTYTYGPATRTETDSKGLYTQIRLKPVEELTLLGGARLSWHELTSRTAGSSTVSTVEANGQVTPYAGVTYDISPTTTLYASYTEIFQPQSNLDAAGNVLKPMEGRQFEIGAKASLANGLDVSGAIFQLDHVNRALAVPATTYFEAQGKVRVKGAEIEVAGEINDNLHLSGGYTYTFTEYLNGPSSGTIFSTFTPRHLFKLSLEYDVTEGRLEGWSFGGHLTAMTGFSSRGVEAPGYSVLDLAAKKKLNETTDLRIAVSNVFDKDYYSRVGATTVFNFRGEPRTLDISLTKRF